VPDQELQGFGHEQNKSESYHWMPLSTGSCAAARKARYNLRLWLNLDF
jgi:hypothetical protein